MTIEQKTQIIQHGQGMNCPIPEILRYIKTIEATEVLAHEVEEPRFADLSINVYFTIEIHRLLRLRFYHTLVSSDHGMIGDTFLHIWKPVMEMRFRRQLIVALRSFTRFFRGEVDNNEV